MYSGRIYFLIGSLLKISCSQCQETNNIPTGKRHGTNVWDINTKLGAGMKIKLFKSKYKMLTKSHYIRQHRFLVIFFKNRFKFSFLLFAIYFFNAAALFCGQGEMIINNFLAALNIPTVTPVTFKRREREVGSSFEAVANETCNEALNEEKQRY